MPRLARLMFQIIPVNHAFSTLKHGLYSTGYLYPFRYNGGVQ